MKKWQKLNFSWLEFWISVLVIAAVIIVITSAVLPAQKRNRDALRKTDLEKFSTQLESFAKDYGIYPNSTYYLGSFTNNGNAKKANYGVSADVSECSMGESVNMAAMIDRSRAPDLESAQSLTPKQLDSLPLKLKPGYVSVNNFLQCLGYADHQTQEPLYVGLNRYQYRVTHNYKQFILVARLERTTDPAGSKFLFADGAQSSANLYFTGNGKEARQLDDDSNLPEKFFQLTGPVGSASDGKYFYQCYFDGLGAIISEDKRKDFPPLIKNVDGTWSANAGTERTNCQSQIDSKLVTVGSN